MKCFINDKTPNCVALLSSGGFIVIVDTIHCDVPTVPLGSEALGLMQAMKVQHVLQVNSSSHSNY